MARLTVQGIISPSSGIFRASVRDDSAQANQQKFVDDCYRFLAPAPGVLHFSAGARAASNTREVNDSGFDVALTILFESTEAHDAYQVWERHKQFISANSGSWKQVRVFDSLVR